MAVPSDYNPNIPQSTDLLSVSQGNILLNFQAIQALIDVNHVDFAATGAGKHAFVEMPVQSPVPTTVGGEVGLYCQTSSITSQPELVFARQSGSSAPSQVRISEFTSGVWANPGWARLPSGFLIKWRSDISFGSSRTVTINVNTDFTSPAYTTLFSVNITGQDMANNWNNVIAVGGSSFPNILVYTSSVPAGTVSFNYLLIGI